MNDLLVLGAKDVDAALSGREQEVLDAVRRAYVAHERGASSLPFSSFLRFPDHAADRIIALPAYLGGDFALAGIKWIASVPGNLARGLERASAVVVLNDRATGRPFALLEGSIVSRQRTAASAALAARALRAGRPPEAIGFVGCGPINREVARFLTFLWPEVTRFAVLDLDRQRATSFARHLADGRPERQVAVAESLDQLLRTAPVVSFATTAIEPHVGSADACPAGATLLHVSLRDLAPQVLLDRRVVNVVDDLEHVCRERTSIHLAAELTGRRGFVSASIGGVLAGTAELPPLDDRVTVFSPFGLGILDLAVADLVVDTARRTGGGTRVPSFLP